MKTSRYFAVLTVALSIGHPLQSYAQDEPEFKFTLPSTATLSVSGSNTETRSGAMGLHYFFSSNYWIDVSADSSTEKTDSLETKTTGAALSLGTDPLATVAVDVGGDATGVKDQYSVREGHVRVTWTPEFIDSFDFTFEYRRATFAFTNTPNSVFSESVVELPAHSGRLEVGFFGWSPLSLRIYGEKSQVDSRFSDLGRTLAPLVIPSTAISTALAWPESDLGFSVRYSGARWGFGVGASQKRAAVTGERTGTLTLTSDYEWNRKVTSGLRVTTSRPTDDTSADPIHTMGLELTYRL